MDTEQFWIWLAGFIDGDGSIGFYSPAYGQPKATVQIGQKTRDILDFIVQQVGTGSVHPAHFKDRQYWGLTFGSAASRMVCEKVAPFLQDKGKKERALQAIQWRRLRPGEIANSPEKHPKFSEVVRLYQAGRSPSEIEGTTGIPAKTAHRWVGRAGALRPDDETYRLRGEKTRGKQKTTRHTIARIKAIERRKEGWTQQAIAEEAGVHINTVRYWLKVARQQPPSSS